MSEEQLLGEVNRLREQGRFRQAYEYVQENEDELALSCDVDELRDDLRRDARHVIDDVRGQIETEFARHPREFDRDELVDDLITAWENAVLSGSDVELESIQRRVRTRRLQQEKIVTYETIDREVQELLDQAQQESQAGAAPQVLQTIYERAYEIARDAAAQHDDNERLQALLESTRAKRERSRIAQEALTSGALKEQYVLTLAYIDTADNNEFLDIVDRYGNPIGRFPKDEALRRTEEEARAFAEAKLVHYMDEARKRLNEYKPREAHAALAEYRKFEEAEEVDLPGLETRRHSLDDLVNDLIQPDRRREINDLETEIDTALTALDEAETLAQTGLDLIVEKNNISEAWRAYQDALNRYAGAIHSGDVQRLQREIENAAVTQLEENAAQLDDLINRHELEDAHGLAADVLDRFGQMESELRGIVGLLSDIDRRHADIQHVRDTLSHVLENLENDNINAASSELRALQGDRRYRPYYEGYERYDEVSLEVAGRQDEQSEIDTLRTFLSNPRRDRVARALESARRSAEQSTAYRQDFDDLVQQLEAYLLYLDADRRVADEGYTIVVEDMETVLDSGGLESELAKKLDDKLEDLREKSREIDQNQDKLERGQKLLSDGKYGEAYAMIKSAKYFESRRDRRHRDQLLADAREQWSRQLVDEFRDLNIDTPFDRPAKHKALEDLRELDPDQADRVQRRYAIYEGAQLAREHENAGRLEDALSQWHAMEDRANWDEQLTIQQHINRLNKRKKDMEVKALLEPGERGADEQALKEWLGRLVSASKELADLAANSRDPLDQIQYTSWHIEVMLGHAQYTPDIRTRRDLFNTISDVADRLNRHLNVFSSRQLTPDERAVLSNATELVELAHDGPGIGDAMRAVEDHIQPDTEIALFWQAVQGWDRVFATHAERLRGLTRWYSDHLNSVQQALRSQLNTIADDNQDSYADLTPKTLPLYAKLLLLDQDDPHGEWMLRELPRLSASIDRHVSEIAMMVFAPDGIQPGQAKAVLEDKRKEIESYLDHVRMIRELMDMFTQLGALREQDTTLIQTCSDQIERLEITQRRLVNFMTQGDDFAVFVRNYEPRDDGENSWHNFEDEFKDAWREFVNRVRDIDDELHEHPWVKEDLRARFDKRLNELRGLIRLLVNIQTNMENEAFEDAFQQMEAINDNPVYEETLSNMLLYKDYRVVDKWKDSEAVGWDKACELIEKRKTCFDTIYANWAQAFGAPSRVSEEELNDGRLPAPAPNVVDWPAKKSEALAAKDRGDFHIARALITCVMSGEGDVCDDSVYALNAALAIVKQPPLAEDPAKKGDYTLAQKRAGSWRGWYLLEWMDRHRLQLYTDQLRDAEQTLKRINDAEDDWDRNLNDYNGELRAIAARLDGRRRLNRRDKVAVKDLVGKIHEILGNLRSICPDHALLENLERHPVLNEAMEKAS